MMKTLFYAILSTAVTAGAAMVPDGFYYEKNDHLQTRSESLFFTYKFAPSDEEALRRGVKFELSNLANETVRTGESREFELRDGLAVYRLLPPEKMAELPSAWYNLTIAPAGEETNTFDLKFQLDSTPYRSRVVYLLDNATPEGYARWLNREFPGELEPLRDFPEDGSAPAAIVVSSYREVDAPTVEKLRKYVEDGGTLLLFGVNHSSLDALNALAQNRDDLYSYVPSKVTQCAALPELTGSAVYPVNATAAPGAEILATADDGKILAAVKTIGSGKSYAFAGALKPNAGYRAMLAKALQLKSQPLPSPRPRRSREPTVSPKAFRATTSAGSDSSTRIEPTISRSARKTSSGSGIWNRTLSQSVSPIPTNPVKSPASRRIICRKPSAAKADASEWRPSSPTGSAHPEFSLRIRRLNFSGSSRR